MKSKRRIVSLVLALLLTAIGIYGVMIGANAEEATVSEPIKFVDANGAVDESVLFAVYDADGNLVKTYTSESDFVTACDSLNTKNTRGTVELYSDVTSGKIFTGETGNATNVYVTIKLNGYTLTPSADWIKLAKNQ